ncbi:hypothetical protein FPOA_09433 [Fusarium poae]|uniref:Uncharacterized protein n=1 Tax=Fusarium poae TaxID=36050 RepID=A0A1B8AB42_FUSPO|nr:hypothetical protein FPOA_09433 [Fusarium poae]
MIIRTETAFGFGLHRLTFSNRFDPPFVQPLRLLPLPTPELATDPAAYCSRALVVSSHDQHASYAFKALITVITCFSNWSNQSSYAIGTSSASRNAFCALDSLASDLPASFSSSPCSHSSLVFFSSLDATIMSSSQVKAISPVLADLDASRHCVVRDLRKWLAICNKGPGLTDFCLDVFDGLLIEVARGRSCCCLFSVTEASFISHPHHAV